MTDKPEDNYIDKLFRDSVNNMETEPSEQFWNKAYETILQNENRAYEAKIRVWRGVAAVLAIAVIGLIGFNVYTNHTINGIEQKVEGLEKTKTSTGSQSMAVNTTNAVQPVSKSNDVVAANEASSVVTSNSTTQASQARQGALVTSYGSFSKTSRHTASPVIANNNAAQSTQAYATKNSGKAYNSMYLDDRTSSITIPAPDMMNSNILAMDDEDKSSIGTGHLDGEENVLPVRPKQKSRPKLSVSVYGAQSIAAPIIKDNNAADNLSATDITGREHQESAFMVGVNTGYDVSRKLTIQAGCEYRSYKFSLAPTMVDVNTGELNSGYSLATSSGTLYMPYIPGYSSKGYDTSAVAKGNAVRTYISIPITMKYRFLSDPKFGLYFRVGTSLNVLANNYASIHCQNRLGEEDVQVYDIQGARTINFSYLLSFGAECKLGRGFALYVEPSYSGAITPNTTNSPITTYSCYFDLTAGLTYHF